MRQNSNSNIREFRPPNPASIGCARVYAAVFYLIIGWQLLPPDGNDINMFFILAILYWAFIQKKIHTTVRFRQSIVLVVILVALVLFVYKDIALWLAGVALLYWLLIVQTRGNSYFLRYHLLSALVLGFSLALMFLIVSGTVQCVVHLLAFAGMAALATLITGGLDYIYPIAALVVCGGTYVYMAISALLGLSPKLPFVTPNVQYMA